MIRREFSPAGTETLPFTVSMVASSEELASAVATRFGAYDRHGAPGAAALREPESDDHRGDVIVVIARQKIDGRVIGTLRIQPNFEKSMRFEESVTLPPAHVGRRSVELMRLGVLNGSPGRMVTAALAKASFLICQTWAVDFVYAAGRRPVDAIYRSYQFDDLLNGGTIEISYAPGAKHSILCLPLAEAKTRWQERNFALYSFMCLTHHPDIRINEDVVRAKIGVFALA